MFKLMLAAMSFASFLIWAGVRIYAGIHYDTMIGDYGGHRMPLCEGGPVFAQASLGYQNFQRTMKNLTALRKVIMPRYWVQAGSPVMEGQTG